MGRLLGMGLRYEEARAKHMPDDTVEGAELALAIGPTVDKLIEKGLLDREPAPPDPCHNRCAVPEHGIFRALVQIQAVNVSPLGYGVNKSLPDLIA